MAKKASGSSTQKLNTDCKIEMVSLAKITGNSAQSRGMGVLSRLQELGYGVFEPLKAEKGEESKPPIWGMLMDKDADERAKAVALIEENEPGLVALAGGIHTTGQLEPIGIHDGEVIFGMRRALATAYNAAKHGDPSEVQAKVYTQKLSETDLIFLSLEENNNREDESPIDKALTYKRLQKECGQSVEDIAARVQKSGQHVRDYMKLISPSLADKRMKIHTRDMSVVRALELYKKRKAEGEGAEEVKEEKENKDGRVRFPSAKALSSLYTARSRPKKMTEKEWTLWTDPAVRKLLAYKLGLKYSEYKEAAPEKEDGKGEETKGKVLNVKRERAVELLICLGKMDARTWPDDKVSEKLENIINILEPGQVAETESLQKLLDRLVSGYKEGLKVAIVKDDKKKK